MRSRQEVTDEEIQRYMNFDKLLLEKERLTKDGKNIRLIRNTGIILGSLAFMVVLFFFFNAPAPDSSNAIVMEQNTPVLNQTQMSEGFDSVKIAGEAKEDKRVDRSEKITMIPKSLSPNKNSEANKSQTDAEQSKTPDDVYVQAEPVNGYPDLYAYFDRALAYPQEAIKDSIQGVVTAVFLINAAGQAEGIQIENSLGKAFDQEVFEVIENMPPWIPASYNGKVVKSKISVPLTFQLKKLNPND